MIKNILFNLLGISFFLAVWFRYGNLFLKFLPLGLVCFVLVLCYGIVVRKKRNFSYKVIFSMALFAMGALILFLSVRVQPPREAGSFSRSSIDYDF